MCSCWAIAWTGTCFSLLHFLKYMFCTILIERNFLLHQPLFPGESGVDQLVEIIKVILTFYQFSISYIFNLRYQWIGIKGLFRCLHWTCITLCTWWKYGILNFNLLSCGDSLLAFSLGRFWALQQGRKSNAWILTIRSSSSLKSKLTRGTRYYEGRY